MAVAHTSITQRILYIYTIVLSSIILSCLLIVVTFIFSFFKHITYVCQSTMESIYAMVQDPLNPILSHKRPDRSTIYILRGQRLYFLKMCFFLLRSILT